MERNGWKIAKEFYADGPSLFVWTATKPGYRHEFARRRDAVAFADEKIGPIEIASHVWCDHHCTIHQAETNPYGFPEPECNSTNWRQVYVLGAPGEEF